jgi:hypothetical protein
MPQSAKEVGEAHYDHFHLILGGGPVQQSLDNKLTVSLATRLLLGTRLVRVRVPNREGGVRSQQRSEGLKSQVGLTICIFCFDVKDMSKYAKPMSYVLNALCQRLASAFLTTAAHCASCLRWLQVHKQQRTCKECSGFRGQRACRTFRQPCRNHVELLTATAIF